jgi:hypothetical protein
MRQRYKDPGAEKFVKSNLSFTTDPYLLYQDPTILGFKLLFFFNNTGSKLLSTKEGAPNTAYNYLNKIGDYARASYLKKFVEHLQKISTNTPWFFQTITGLGDAWKRGYQAEVFSAALPIERKITIGCLESIDLRMSALIDLYRKSCFDWHYRREIVPWNLRTFDVYIYVYEVRLTNRSGTPSRFSVLDIKKSLGLSEINDKQQKENAILLGEDPFGSEANPNKTLKDRTSDFLEGVGVEPIKALKPAGNTNAPGNEKANTINPYINRIMFKFSLCEFLPDDSGDTLTDIKAFASTDGFVQQKLSFSYRDVEEINLYNIYSGDQFVQDNIINILDQSALDNEYLYGKIIKRDPTEESFGVSDITNNKFNMLLPFASMASDKAAELLTSTAGKLLLGNVYGFSALESINTASNILSEDPARAVQAAQSIASNFLSKSLRNATNDTRDLGSMEKGTSPANATNDVNSLGNALIPSQSQANATNDVITIGNALIPSQSQANETKDVSSLGNNYK